VIKKIEHFWKGLSNDRTQISASPPDEYSDRFYRFIEGVTMSPEEAEREAEREREAAADAQQAATSGEGEGRGSSWSSRRRSTNTPVAPTRSPPAIPPQRSPDAQATIEKASTEAKKTDSNEDVPNRTIGTKTEKAGTPQQQILPVVEESGETSSTGGRSQVDERLDPPTPPKNGAPVNRSPRASSSVEENRPVTPMKSLPRRSGERGPETPPKYLNPDSGDSGYGGNGPSPSRESSLRAKGRISRESLDKDLPPLPKGMTVDGNGQS
jgi:1-phosphatidylinositol-4-phosphate 5-kinase